MPEEENNVTSQTTETSDNNQYIEALNQLKANSVDKAEYDKLKAENKKLLDSIVNGTEVALPAGEKESINDLRLKLINSNDEGMSSLEYTKVALKLRERLIEEVKKIHSFLMVHNIVLHKWTTIELIELLLSYKTV